MYTQIIFYLINLKYFILLNLYNIIKIEIDIRENIKQKQPINKIKSYPNINLNEIDLAFNNLSMLGI